VPQVAAKHDERMAGLGLGPSLGYAGSAGDGGAVRTSSSPRARDEAGEPGEARALGEL